MLRYALLIYQDHTQQAAQTALEFAKAARAQGHIIERVFFYGAGVLIAQKAIEVPEDEYDCSQAWRSFAEDAELTLHVCVAAGARRGLSESVIEAPFALAGLGELADASHVSDRLITFGRYAA